MRSAAILPSPLPAPALALAGVPALATVAVIGFLLSLAVDRFPGTPPPADPYQLWRDKDGVVRELKLVGLKNDAAGSKGEFLTREGATVLHRITDLQTADQARAWDAAFALDPVLSFKQATIRKTEVVGQRYTLCYSFDVSVLPIRSIKRDSLKINRVPVESLHGMTIWPGYWSPALRFAAGSIPFPARPGSRWSSQDDGPAWITPVEGDSDRVDLVATGFFYPPSMKGALAEGSVMAVCMDEVAQEQLRMDVPAEVGGITTGRIGPLQLRLEKTHGLARHDFLVLKVEGDHPGQCTHAGFFHFFRRSLARETIVDHGTKSVVISAGYYRRVKEVEVPFSGTPE
ncbi:hypothetical protein [Luteolibacter sp. Populi]|uniref:hypothetical protein n=1 Tax=Luteolibacter sp. Populi TaxID=3230487 RepID=UPI0034672DB9